MTDEELDEQFDSDPSKMDDDDFDEEMMDEDPNAWQYEEDESDLDDMEHKHRKDSDHMSRFDEDDF